MATSCFLWGTGDILAQRIEHYEEQQYGSSSSSSSKAAVPSPPGDSTSSEGLQQQQHQQAQQQQQQQSPEMLQHSSSKGFTIDQRRTLLTAVGFGAAFVGPVGEFWYSGLEKVCRWLVPGGGGRFLATKVVLDSAVMGSVYVAAFFAFGSLVLEGSGVAGFVKKMQVDFIPTYAAELAFWPLVQTANFSYVPVRHQLLAVNMFSLLDAAFISWVGNQQDWLGKIMGRLGMREPAGPAAAAAPAEEQSKER